MDNPVVVVAVLLVGLVIGVAIGAVVTRAAHGHVPASTAVDAPALQSVVSASLAPLVSPVTASLDQLALRVERVEQDRAAGEAGVREQLARSVLAAERLGHEASRLSGALRSSDVRGRWGEFQLRRLVEVSGLLEHVHFTEQDHKVTDDGALRPDLVVHLGAGRHVVVDAKVPLAAYLEAVESADEAAREGHLRRHAGHVAAHVRRLSEKKYWQQYERSPEFVVLFLPAEPLLSTALAHDPQLLERAFEAGVVITTPATLVALLRTVGQSWREEDVARNAREIHQLGRELHGRLATLSSRLTRLGAGLDSAVRRYNETVACLDQRVLVSARRFHDLGVTGDPLPAPPTITTTTGSASSPDPSVPHRAGDAA